MGDYLFVQARASHPLIEQRLLPAIVQFVLQHVTVSLISLGFFWHFIGIYSSFVPFSTSFTHYCRCLYPLSLIHPLLFACRQPSMTHIFEQPMLSLSPQSIYRIDDVDVDDLSAMWNGKHFVLAFFFFVIVINNGSI